MNRRRAAWVSLAVVVLVLGVWAGPTVWRLTMFKTVHDISWTRLATPGQPPEYTVWAYSRAREPRYSWVGEATGFVVWLGSESDDDEEWRSDNLEHYSGGHTTTYTAAGVVRIQSDDSNEYEASPWPYAVEFTPAEVRQLIYEAKLYVQEAAQRGEVQLPAGWEPVQ